MNQDTIYDHPDLLTTTESGLVAPIEVAKPWGHETLLVRTGSYAMKFLHIDPGQQLSLQYHERKRETLHCLEGKGIALIGRDLSDPGELEAILFAEGMTLHIEPGTIHTYRALTAMRIVEVSTPEIDDVVRLEDRYGRAPDVGR